MMYTHSLSSYLYGKEKTQTDGGNMVVYRKALENIESDGNVIFIDIDNKVKIDDGVDDEGMKKYRYIKAIGDDYVSKSRLIAALEKLDVLGVVTESKSSKEDWRKYHVAIITQGVGDAAEFTNRYLGFIEALGIEAKGLDLIMRVPTQNMTPAYENVKRPKDYLEGNPLPFTEFTPSVPFMDSLAATIGPVGGAHQEFEGDVSSLVLRRQNKGDFIETGKVYELVKAALSAGATNGKIRTQCHHGKPHDGRYDSGFIRFHEDESVIKSHCSVCGDSAVIWTRDITALFDDLEELPEENKKRDHSGQPVSLDILKDIGVAVDYEASTLEPLDEQKLIFNKALHLFFAPSGYFKSFTVASLVEDIDKDKYYFDFEHNPAGLKEHCEVSGITYVTPPNDLRELKKILKSDVDCSDALFIFDSFSNLITEGNNDATDTANIVKLMHKMVIRQDATVIFIDHATKLDYKELKDSPKDWNFKLEGNESGKKKPCEMVYKLQPINVTDYRAGVKLMVEKSRSADRFVREIITLAGDVTEAFDDEKF